MHTEYILILTVITSFILFCFIYWRDATNEGFGSDKIFDSIISMIIGGFLGGKILFRDLSVDYFQYQFLSSPLILEGVLVGGGLALFLIVKHNKWSGWKIGDMIVPALAAFQSVLFFGFWLINKDWNYFLVFIMFFFLYIFIRYLKYNKQLGLSSQFFQMKRLNKITFTGGILTVYLTCSSLIAILFLLINRKLDSKFWWFQVIFYLSAFLLTLLLFRRRINKKGLVLMNMKNINIPNINSLKSKLFQIKKREKEINDKDPFIQEVKEDGYRNLDEIGEEAADLSEHQTVQAVKGELKTEEKEINATLKDIEEGKYGVCKDCGNNIEEARLNVYPTAQYCIKCQEKKDQKQKRY